MKHKSVLLNEVIDTLDIKPEGIYVDMTLGYAGHSGQILKKLNKKGFLFAFDQDIEAIEYSKDKLSSISDNFKIIKSNFVNIKDYITESLDGVIFDLGVSSPQLDEADRGFSFHKDAKLDMRMDRSQELSAYSVVNEYSEKKLTEIIFKYGEEKYSRSIAKAIVNNRPIDTTLQLAQIIKDNVPISYRNETHPARKAFQAIRIEVNNELEILEKSILDAFSLLKIGGRISIITFHSLEDKRVSNVLKKLCEDDKLSSKLPFVPEEMKAKAKYIIKTKPTDEEINENNRARSSKLRVIERIR